jgi:hypothetical protein
MTGEHEPSESDSDRENFEGLMEDFKLFDTKQEPCKHRLCWRKLLTIPEAKELLLKRAEDLSGGEKLKLIEYLKGEGLWP